MANLQPVVGAVLDWAIQDAGQTVASLDLELGFGGKLRLWIAEDELPNQGQLAKIARRLGRPPSFFFLPEPPSAPAVSARYRKFAGTDRDTEPETIVGLRLARNLQKTAEWVLDRIPSSGLTIPALKMGADVEAAAQSLRQWAGWTVLDQTTSKDYSGSSAAKMLRRRLEERGVLVLHLTLDEDRTRGFSLASERAPLVAVNTRDDYKPRLFSYVHELVHLALGEGAVCDVHEDDEKTERFCNKVAAAFLMPAPDFRTHVKKQLRGRPVATLDDVAAIRGRYRVSLRAAAIRAEHLRLATFGLYDRVNRLAESKRKGGGGNIPGNERTKPRIRVDEYGFEFVRTVESGVESGLLRDAQAADLMRVSTREWDEIRSLAHSGVVG
ncbi:ImmA/IrrE family metallo-endopeptidase [Curtobacterium flaccumfaciens]|uniref:ImmA/IrrE family metallo-endopeptidase n=1 Tax=Curtobacterium flaccumfaciens TaxID=2035 RepID=UPI0016034820|nr:ImmA/IrrE family metallo-endopeptidase [Curtobacterium flaccumfaciens]